ncbi:MAG: hypothetical protein ACXQTY_01810 [Candidatus Methanogasteraceae archaeon]
MKMEDKIADDARIMYPTPEILLQRPPAGASDTVAARLVMGGIMHGLGCEISVHARRW